MITGLLSALELGLLWLGAWALLGMVAVLFAWLRGRHRRKLKERVEKQKEKMLAKWPEWWLRKKSDDEQKLARWIARGVK